MYIERGKIIQPYLYPRTHFIVQIILASLHSNGISLLGGKEEGDVRGGCKAEECIVRGKRHQRQCCPKTHLIIYIYIQLTL